MKYKHAKSEGWYYQIDDNGIKSQSWNKKNRPMMYAEMMAWVKAGNEIEPRFTASELAEKETSDNLEALDSQNKTIFSLLGESDKKVNGSYPNTDGEKSEWEIWRGKLRVIFKNGKIQTIPPEPFS